MSDFNPKRFSCKPVKYDYNRSVVHNICMRFSTEEKKAKAFEEIFKSVERIREDVFCYSAVRGTKSYAVISLRISPNGKLDFMVSCFDDSSVISEAEMFERIKNGEGFLDNISGGNSNYYKESYLALEQLTLLVSGKDMVKELLW